MGITGLSTGFNSVDNKLHGLRGGQLIIIAGRPGSGKTAFCLNMATRMALSGKKCLYFSLEMSKDELAMRAIVSEARADNERLRAGLIDRKTLQRLVDASARLNDAKLFIDDKADINVFEARTRARQLHREQGIDCIFIDYMQLMSGPPDMPRHLRYEIISEISRKLKALAKELDVPVVALAQLSRDIEKRSDKRPQLSDLRESGQIEQDADIVGFIHRPYLYSGDDTEKGLAELCIKKHRNGVQCDIPLIFIGEYMRFDDRDKRHD